MKFDFFLQFDESKLGRDELSKEYREQLEHDLIQMHCDVIKMAELYNDNLNSYTVSMESLLNSTTVYYDKNELTKIHQDKKMLALELVIYLAIANNKIYFYVIF